MTFWSKELMQSVMQNFWEKKKGIFSSFLWFSTLEGDHAYLNHHCEPVAHHISILFVLDKADTLSLLILVIIFKESCVFGDLNQVFFDAFWRLQKVRKTVPLH